MFEIMRKIIKINTAKLVLFSFIFYVVSAFIVYLLEPDNFKNPFIAFWWVMTTVTTIGYGDYVPRTTPGMIYGIFLYLFGIGLIGIILGKIVDFFTYYGRLKMEGKLDYTGKDHFLIIGWSKSVQQTIEEILLSRDVTSDVVLIDSLKEAPFKNERFHYIQGDPTDKKILRKAGIDKTRSVSIFASGNHSDVLMDGKTLLVASSIERYAVENEVNIYTIAEIVNQNHVDMFMHAGVNEFVLSNEGFPHLMAKALLNHGSTRLLMELLNHTYGENIWEIKPSVSWKTYRDAFDSLRERGANLIAEGSDFSIVRRLDEVIPSDARLYIITDQKTYDTLDVEKL
ncbi:potassium channel family protein [Planococcus sp. APC 3906]|uniref:potassium channel family protein n=1 Tax=Planococcus sp. APC 3906 TaxID=3035194 RepID=UPI0025B55FA5|nr:potassium channel family protein [Planococcus sp. APC 3906]MDN3449387.1 potassium channel family protein [Planococcus sp. APC 3906]